MLSLDIIRRVAKGKVNEANAQSFLLAYNSYGSVMGLEKAHRLAQFLPQLLHESADFRYDREIWGPTAAQKRYDTRTDLGNTAAADGDGKLFMGRTGIQITGKANYAAFRDWCRKKINPQAPDFVAKPDLVNTDPWEGLGPFWYWDVGNPERKSLNRYADDGNAEMVTRRINGGLNGYADRLDYVVRVSLVLLGYQPTAVKMFQGDYDLKPDGVAGPATRAALHKALVKLDKSVPQGGVIYPPAAPQPIHIGSPVNEVAVPAPPPKPAPELFTAPASEKTLWQRIVAFVKGA